MRTVVAALVVCMGVHAATTIAQARITGPDGRRLASGKITITATAAFTAAGGAHVDTTPLTVNVVNGAFTVSLEPNDSGVPAGSQYVATWQLDGAKARQDRWLVPTSGAVLSVNDVLVSTLTLPFGWLVQWQQLGRNGAATGQAPVWNGSSWQPGYVTGAGAAWGSIVGTLADQPDLAAALATTYTATFTAQTAVTISGVTHGLGTSNLTVQCWDATTPAHEVEADTITIGSGTYDVSIAFVIPQSGKCVVRR